MTAAAVTVRHEDFAAADDALARLHFTLWIAGWTALGDAIARERCGTVEVASILTTPGKGCDGPCCAGCSGRGWFYENEDDLNGTYCGCAAGDDQRARDGAASRDSVG